MSEKKKAVNLVMSTHTRERIEALKEKMDCDTLSEVIRKSVELMEVVVQQKEEGNELILRSEARGDQRIVLV